uniref:Myb/SANT-like DNA-binding domain-containing protein n=1 Tax=Branchiostoma floridae TaxID=7739 RepID=C3ZAZ8_BRAFL|eukprot:XP_002594024.1 hypothetical protein BRAFLDRAFT_68536 [Branchiostoma floridae]
MDSGTKAMLALWGQEETQRKLSKVHKNKDTFEQISSGMVQIGFDKSCEQCRTKVKKLKPRMRWVLFDFICTELGGRLTRQNTRFREAISVTKRAGRGAMVSGHEGRLQNPFTSVWGGSNAAASPSTVTAAPMSTSSTASATASTSAAVKLSSSKDEEIINVYMDMIVQRGGSNAAASPSTVTAAPMSTSSTASATASTSAAVKLSSSKDEEIINVYMDMIVQRGKLQVGELDDNF